MKKFLAVLAIAFTQGVVYAQPVINSFSPQAALPLSEITISGSGFSTVTDNNIVYFGPVKGKVINAAANQLTVKVPVGAVYSIISVTSEGLTSFSHQFFTPLSTASGYPFDNTSFAPAVFISSIADKNRCAIQVYDADGDGKADIIAADTSGSSVSFYRNTATAGIINNNSFAPSTYRNNGNSGGNSNYPFILADLNGDGKKDLAVNDYSNPVKFFKNASTAGNILLTDSSAVVPDSHFPEIANGDIDGDGKIDVALIFVYQTNFIIDSMKIRVYKNTGDVGGDIAFTLQPFRINQQPTPNTYNLLSNLKLADFNNDNKPDLVYYNWGDQKFYILKNNSTGGNISFEAPVSFTYTSTSFMEQVRFGDIDNDGFTDMVSCNGHSKKVSIFRNTSNTTTALSFAAPVDLIQTRAVYDVTIDDFDGDGKADIACVGMEWEPNSGSFLNLYKNLSTPGNVNFSKTEYGGYGIPSGIAGADVDGDGRQDIVIGNAYGGNIAVLRNKMGGPQKVTACASGWDTLMVDGGANYQWQLSTDSVNFTDLTNNNDYADVQTKWLTIKTLNSSMYGYRYRCIIDGTYSKVFELNFKNTWTGEIDSTWENPGNWSCYVLPDANSDVIIPSGTVVLSSNASCRSIHVAAGANFTVAPGFILTVTH